MQAQWQHQQRRAVVLHSCPRLQHRGRCARRNDLCCQAGVPMPTLRTHRRTVLVSTLLLGLCSPAAYAAEVQADTPPPPPPSQGACWSSTNGGDSTARAGPSPVEDTNGKPAERLSDQEAKALLDEEEARRRARRRNKGRLQELQEIRAELAEREAELLEKEKELLEKEQTVAVLREEVRSGRAVVAQHTYACSWRLKRGCAHCCPRKRSGRQRRLPWRWGCVVRLGCSRGSGPTGCKFCT